MSDVQIQLKPAQPKLTRIIFVLDRSGSMCNIWDEAVGSLNSFIEDQKQIPGDATLTMILFDDKYEVIYENVPLKDVKPFDKTEYQPRGWTALYDAVGVTINRYEASDPDTKTIFAILTDGMENKSQEFTSYDQVKAKTTHAQDALGWDILFLGANMNAKSVAGSMGVKLNKTATFDFTGKGATDAFSSMSYTVGATRGFAPEGTAYAAAANFMDGDFEQLYKSVAKGEVKK